MLYINIYTFLLKLYYINLLNVITYYLLYRKFQISVI